MASRRPSSKPSRWAMRSRSSAICCSRAVNRSLNSRRKAVSSALNSWRWAANSALNSWRWAASSVLKSRRWAAIRCGWRVGGQQQAGQGRADRHDGQQGHSSIQCSWCQYSWCVLREGNAPLAKDSQPKYEAHHSQQRAGGQGLVLQAPPAGRRYAAPRWMAMASRRPSSKPARWAMRSRSSAICCSRAVNRCSRAVNRSLNSWRKAVEFGAEFPALGG